MDYDKMLDELAAAGWPTPSSAPTVDGFAALSRLPVAPKTARSGMPTPAAKARPVLGKHIPVLMAALAEPIRSHTAREIAKAVEPLCERIAELEARPVPKWRGPYVHGASYSELAFTVHGGALWVAERATSQRPGSDNSGWRLCCKRGSHDDR